MSELSNLLINNLFATINCLVLMIASVHFLNPNNKFNLAKVLVSIALFLLVSIVFFVYHYKLPLAETMLTVFLPTNKGYYSHLDIIYLLTSFVLITPLLKKVIPVLSAKIYLYLLALYFIKALPNLLLLLDIEISNISYIYEVISSGFVAYILGYFLHSYHNKKFYMAIAGIIAIILVAQASVLKIGYPNLTNKEFLTNFVMFASSIEIVQFLLALLLFKLICRVGLIND